jgi:hypothetical protein
VSPGSAVRDITLYSVISKLSRLIESLSRPFSCTHIFLHENFMCDLWRFTCRPPSPA